MPENNATLKKKNQELREQVNALSEEICKLKEHITEHTSSPDRSARSTEAALQFYSDAHDESQTFQADVSKELKRLSTWLAEISTRVDEIGKAIDSMCEYSYQYNVKIVGMPELSEQESYSQTSALCVKLFSDMGADVSLHDIDIAHRVPQRNATAGAPKPIICKFVRRLSKEAVMARRNDACKANPSSLGFGEGVSLSSVRIFDHLTPKMQHVFTEAKKFKGQNNYQFCWTKNSCVYLRKDGSSRALKIRNVADLSRLG